MYTPFLRQVAQYFQEKGDIGNYCFVLPNRRSCTFLERELDLAAKNAYFMPDIITITDLVTRLSGLTAVPAVEAVFKLYKCYVGLSGNEEYPFDNFVYWANVVLNDFNDVDMYLVDPEQIFTNVRELREIQANYLDDDVREIVSRYLNMSVEGSSGDDDSFWKDNYKDSGSEDAAVKASFMRLWRSLLQLYREYNQSLSESGLSSMGNIYRSACEAVKDGNDLGHEKYVFVGFNILSASELAIFKRLQNRGKALFFWDAASPAFKAAKGFPVNPGGMSVNFLLKAFPQPIDFVGEEIDGFPKIEAVGVPSDVGQTRYASEVIATLSRENSFEVSNGLNTALVLPDESLFVPMLNCLGDGIDINVTMGYPLPSSDIASLMRIVAKMHRQARRKANDEWTFYRSDVRTLLSHPLIKVCYPEDALNVTVAIDNGNLFAVPQSLMLATGLAPLFRGVDNLDSVEDVRLYLDNLIGFCNDALSRLSENGGNDENNEDNEDNALTLQEAFVMQYIEVLTRLDDALSRYKLPPCEATIFFLIDRLSSMFSIPFEGEPLQGMQIMGVLETRCLDFENVIILSANEDVLPRKMRSNSFISDYMRKAYHMSTVADQEAMWAYNFYRLISRAENVFLIYDTSTKSSDSKEVTRYVPQLEMVYGCDIAHIHLNLKTNISKDICIDVPKKDHVTDVLESFKKNGSRKLSASAINEYINCPLMFYFHRVERLSTDDVDEDFMGAGIIGTIVHETLQQVYYPDENGAKRQGEFKVTCADIERFKTHKLKDVVKRKVNEKHVRTANLDAPLNGEAAIISVAIQNMVTGTLNYDMKLLNNIDSNYFTVLECEQSHDISLDYGGVEFNFTYTADRIDRLADGTIRMVDYKTGSDKTEFKDMNDLFDANKDKRSKAVLQLMLYCNAYAKEMKCTEAIKPVIYQLRDINQSGVFNVVDKSKEEVTDYHDFNEEFTACMDEVINGFFNLDNPFSQTTNTKPKSSPCRYCKFVDFCRR